MYTRNKWTGFGKSSIWLVRLLRLHLHIFAKTKWKESFDGMWKARHHVISQCISKEGLCWHVQVQVFSCLTGFVFYGIHKGPYFILFQWTHFQATWCNMDKLLTRTNTGFMTSSDQNIDNREWKGLCVGQSGAPVAIIISNQSNDSQSRGCKRTKPADVWSILYHAFWNVSVMLVWVVVIVIVVVTLQLCFINIFKILCEFWEHL